MLNTSKYHWVENQPRCAIAAEQLEILTSADSFRQRLMSLIEEAKKRIYITALYLQNDEAGRAVLEAIYLAKQRHPGLDVHILVDYHRAQRGLIGVGPQVGNDQFYRETAEKFHPTSIQIHGVPVKSREWAGVLHMKGFIVDDRVLFSGASLNNVYLGVNGKYRFDRYHVIESKTLAESMVSYIKEELIGNPAVVSLLDEPIPGVKQLRRDIKYFKFRLSRSRYWPLNDYHSKEPIKIYPLVGIGRKNNQLNSAILKLLKSAEETVLICTPYFNLPRQLSQVVAQLLRKRVQVTIVVGDKTANDFYTPPEEPFSSVGALPYLYEQNLKRFAKRHQRQINTGNLTLRIWKHDNNSFHLKGIQVDDDAYLLTGSNLNPRAWALDLENGLLIQDQKRLLADKFTAERDHIFKHTQVIQHYSDLEKTADYPRPVAKLLRRLGRVRADVLLKRIL